MSGRNAARLPKINGGMPRIHSNMPVAWIKAIERAAKQENVSRSAYIAAAAYKAAIKDLKKSVA